MATIKNLENGREWATYNLNEMEEGIWYEDAPVTINGLQQSMKFDGGQILQNNYWHGYGEVYVDTEMKEGVLWIYLCGSTIPRGENQGIGGCWILNGLRDLENNLDGIEELWEGNEDLKAWSMEYADEEKLDEDWLISRCWDIVVIYLNDEGEESFLCVGSGEIRDLYRLTAAAC